VYAALGRASTTIAPAPRRSGSRAASSFGGRRNPSRMGGPSRLRRFISAKYFGGSGWSASTCATNSSSVAAPNAQLKSFS
jgi:hypothetical protein